MNRQLYFAINFLTAAVLTLQSAVPAHAVISHRYSFTGNANDSVGSANWTVNGGAGFSGGQVVLDGVNDYLDMATTPLPTAVDSNVTIEVWGTYAPTTAVGSRIFDFSNDAGTYLYLTPLATPNTPTTAPVAVSNQRLRFDDGLGEIGPMATGTGNSGAQTLYTAVFDNTGNQLRLYRDGGLIATAAATPDILNILGAVSTSHRLGSGTSTPPGGDLPAFLTGSLNEVRIYDNVQTEVQILVNAIAGPDTLNVVLTDKTFNVAAGDWNTGTNWTAAGVPATADRAVINNAGTATVSAAVPVVGGVAINNGALTIGSGGVLAPTYLVELAPGDTNTATINVNNGGRLTFAAITADALLGAKTINVDGGTLQAGFTNTLVQPGIAVNIGAGGATIDTQTNTSTWTMTAAAATTLGLAGSGTVTKSGSGRLNLYTTTPNDRTMQSPSFTGEFRINAGTVDIAGNSGVFGRAGTRGFGKVTMTNSTLLGNSAAPGTTNQIGADFHIVGDNVIDNLSPASRSYNLQGSFTGNGTLRFRKSVNPNPDGYDFIHDPVNFPNVTNAGFTGRFVMEGNIAVRFRSSVANFASDIPNGILELANVGSWVGKRGNDGDAITDPLNPIAIVELGGVESVGGMEDPANPGTFFYPRLEACIAGCGVATNPPMTYQIGGASQNAEFRGIVQDNQVAATPDIVKVIKVGANTQTFSGPNTYSGTTTVNGGKLLVNGTHMMSATTTHPVGNYTVNAGGTLGGTGTIGSVADPVDINVVGGTLAPGASAGTLTVNGGYAQDASGKLAIEIGGTGAGLFDVLAVTGVASLAGTLDIDLINGFMPASGNSFTVLTAASITGGLALSGESTGFSLQVNPTSLVLNFTAAGVPGDYNNNGTVDTADYVLWRNGGPLMNDPTPGVQDPGDYNFWRQRFGNTSGSGSGAGVGAGAVPEPTAVMLVLVGCAMLGLSLRRA